MWPSFGRYFREALQHLRALMFPTDLRLIKCEAELVPNLQAGSPSTGRASRQAKSACAVFQVFRTPLPKTVAGRKVAPHRPHNGLKMKRNPLHQEPSAYHVGGRGFERRHLRNTIAYTEASASSEPEK
jgi:hypothetical protein